MSFSISNMAKYPFTKEAQDFRQPRQSFLSEEDLEEPEFKRLTDRARNRVIQALKQNIVEPPQEMNEETEIWSFSIAMYIVKTVGDPYLEKRFAEAESNRAYELMKSELDKERLFEIAKGTFGWNIRKEDLSLGKPYDFALYFPTYLSNASGFQADEWKLVNRTVVNSYVYLGKVDVARLLQEEIRKLIESRLVDAEDVPLESVGALADEIRQLLAIVRNRAVPKELPKNAVIAAYPPCIKRLYDLAVAGEHLSHLGRFTLTTFLLNVGLSIDEAVKLFPSQSDFSEGLTRYQVEHLAGKRGSKIRYKPPNCDTLGTHGLCILRGVECRKMKNPLAYYGKKVWVFR
jgi:DNA primase large subunit